MNKKSWSNSILLSDSNT